MKKTITISILLTTTLFSNSIPKSDKWGIEINPTVPIAWGALYSVGISYFDQERGVEYALPIFTSLNAMGGRDENGNKDDWQSIHMDFQYKQYLSGEIGNGIYFGGFGRWSNLEGNLRNSNTHVTENKFGIGGSIGYRTFNFFGYESLYWGVGLNLGTYLVGDNDIFDNDFLLFGDKQYIVDIEFFKFGLSF